MPGVFRDSQQTVPSSANVNNIISVIEKIDPRAITFQGTPAVGGRANYAIEIVHIHIERKELSFTGPKTLTAIAEVGRTFP